MRLDEVYQTIISDDTVRLCAEVSYDFPDDEKRGDLFYIDYPIGMKKYLVDSGDPWLVLFLPICAVIGEALVINKPVDPVLLEECLEILEIWHAWMPNLNVVDILATNLSKSIASENKTASFFSGGVDSMHTLLRHEDSPFAQRAEKVDDLILINGIFLPKKPLEEGDESWLMKCHIDTFAEKLGKQAINVHTNVWETKFRYTHSLNHSHVCLLAASALGIGKRYSRVLIPSSLTYDKLVPESSNPLTDRMWSTSATKFVPDGSSFNRFQKISYLVNKNHDLSFLQVCSRDEGLKNCSVCFKCIKTMLILDVLNYLKDCNLFREPELDLKKVESIYCCTHYLLAEIEMIKSMAADSGRRDILLAIDNMFSRSAWIDSARRLTKKMGMGGVLCHLEVKILEEILGVRNNRFCVESVRQSIDNFLNKNNLFKSYLFNLINSDFSLNACESKGFISDFSMLEHELLSSSVCHSTLHLELKNKSRELSWPEVIYVRGDPVHIGNKKIKDQLLLAENVGFPTASASNKYVNSLHEKDRYLSRKKKTIHDLPSSLLNQEEKYLSDYSDYLCAPESSDRYKIALSQIKQYSENKKIELLDLGCGNGALANYISDNFLYRGLDNNKAAIDAALKKEYSVSIKPAFDVVDVLEWSGKVDGYPKANVLMLGDLLGGALFSMSSNQFSTTFDDKCFVTECISRHLVDGGLVSVVTPFYYDFYNTERFFQFAAQRRAVINESLPLQYLDLLIETVLPLPLVSDAILRQKNKPLWYVNAVNNNGKEKQGFGVWCTLYKKNEIL
ncbi:hypothetical protein IMCC1989_1964 [gamma proteobacterium IMCC1989]|nr:hypothetical protein IMCC1989_1964 [gamma proteobacterium IMCC1989]